MTKLFNAIMFASFLEAKMMKKPKAIQIKTRVDEAMAKQFQEAVESFGEGTSAALRQAIRDFIAKYEMSKKKPDNDHGFLDGRSFQDGKTHAP